MPYHGDSCSWCHHLNSADATYCGHCGHMAHVPRMRCACPKCRPTTGVPWETEADREVIRERARLVRAGIDPDTRASLR